MDINQIKLQVLMLEAQAEGLRVQIKKLRHIQCPKCHGIGTIPTEVRDDQGMISRTDYNICEDCEGSGFACGQIP